MTEAQFRKRAEFWQKKLAPLGIGHWRLLGAHIVTGEMPGSRSATAAMWISDDYDTCRMYINAEYVAESDLDEIDESILHEWLHVAFRDLLEVVSNGETWFTAASWEDFKSHLTHAEERLIDNLARTLFALHAG